MAPHPPRYRLLGGPASPYSLKVRAVLRYRRLPHDWVVPRGFFGEAPELVAADKGILPVLQVPEDGSYHADSTPLLFMLEDRHPGYRSVLPQDPVANFLCRLIEDFADEWLAATMFSFKWHRDVDQHFCSQRQMLGWLGPLSSPRLELAAASFCARQYERYGRISNDGANVTLFETTYDRVLTLLDQHLKDLPFLFGTRPSLADFGLFGPLSQCAIDPTASGIMRGRSLRVYQWVHLLDDCSGVEGDWVGDSEPVSPTVINLLQLIGEVYLPLLEANRQTVLAEGERVEFEVWGRRWSMFPNQYKVKCLGWLKKALHEVPTPARGGLEPVLRQTHCWDLLQPAPGELEQVPPLLPR